MLPTLLLVGSVLLQAVSAAATAAGGGAKGGAACTSDLDCSLAGTCSSGRCDCDAAWTGPTCERLHLLPAHRSAFYPAGGHPTELPSDRPFTWGGSIMKDEAGLYHLFVVEYMNHCPMTYGTWTSQSSVRHATSRSASGPWEPRELPLGPGPTGNPVVTRAPDGTYLMYFTNVPRQNRAAAEPPPRNCSSSQRSDWGPARYCTKQCETGLHLAHSKSLDGPWTVALDITKAGGTNPGVVILKSGKVILFYKGGASFPFKSALCPTGKCRAIGLVTAPAWDSFPYSDFLATGASSDGGKFFGGGAILEDPSNAYVDSRRGALHVLFHQGLSKLPGASGESTARCKHPAEGGIAASNSSCGYGGAAHSQNGSEWIYATRYWQGLSWSNGTRSSVAYEYSVAMDDGMTLDCIRREEPKLLIENGEPSALITQCSVIALGHTLPPFPPSAPKGEVEWSTVMVVQPINTKRPDMPLPVDDLEH